MLFSITLHIISRRRANYSKRREKIRYKRREISNAHTWSY